MKNLSVVVVLVNFLIASLMGLLLRGAFVWEIEWLQYKNMLHAHSHVALLGWLYLGIFVLILKKLVPEEKAAKKSYSILFWLTQISVVGMMIAFPLQGYAAFSIFFSTCHIILSYIFAYRIWKDHNRKEPMVSLLLKTSLVFLILSTLGVWSVGVIMGMGLRGGVLYQMAIQFYLHFQFNGWLLFAVLALLLSTFHNKISLSATRIRLFYGLLLAATILTYALVLFWGYQWTAAYLINSVGVLLQVAAFGVIIIPLLKARSNEKTQLSSARRWLLYLMLIVFVSRVVFQGLLIVPELAEMAVLLRLFIIGFIHLNMLGFFSAYILLEFGESFLRNTSTFYTIGTVFFIAGFLLTELIMFLQGFFYQRAWGKLNFFHEALFVSSVFLPLALLFFLFSLKQWPKFQIITKV